MKSESPLLPFKHREILQTAMPMGGIGAGCVCLNGSGSLQDFSIRNHPETSADPRTGTDAAFATIHVKGSKPVTRLLEGPIAPEKIYNQGLWGAGYRRGGFDGLPRFKKSRFKSGYPFGRVSLSDPSIPLDVDIMGWSPFIPLDDVASGIPCAILEYRFENRTRKPVEFEFSFHLSHLVRSEGRRMEKTTNSVIPEKGIFFSNHDPANAETFGSASLTMIGQHPKIKAIWLRGAWFDALSALWREVESGKFTTNDGRADADHAGLNGGSILVAAKLAPGDKITIPVVITWHFPNSDLTHIGWDGELTEEERKRKPASPAWRPFYASQWADAKQVATYVHRNYESLRKRTIAFQRALLGSTLPAAVLDAVSANLAILKSPTVLRQENGNLWGWEGCNPTDGSCPGSCTHVWNYAQAFPHLFPKLERTLREQELQRSMDEQGHVNFRAALPDGPMHHRGHPAADGQLGGIMKVFRDWQISGDTEWLKGLYPLVKRSLDYCIHRWDPDRKGGLFEPHHNTYDIEFWGPDGMCGSIYLGALSAMSAMAAAFGEDQESHDYAELATKTARFMEKTLFNGEYFEQKVQFRGLRDGSFIDLIEGRRPGVEGKEMLELLKKEGPKYQYGKGCISDGVIGAWMALIYGLDTPLDRGLVRKNLKAIHHYNFRSSLMGHANCQRPGYALEPEAGLLLCSWPRGGKPTLPFVYSDEVWTGIEYQVASHLIAEGLADEGLEIVKAVRSRYEGRIRNPWNEYECGNYYARAMASYALLGAYSGFRYSAVEKTLWFGPKIAKRPFSVFFSTAAGFGTITLGKHELTILVIEGLLDLKRIHLDNGPKVSLDLAVNTAIKSGKPVSFDLRATGEVSRKRK